MPQQPLRILLCGAFDDGEMRPVAASVARLLPGSELRRIRGLDVDEPCLAHQSGDDSWAPDLVIVAQTRPEQFSQAQVRRLQGRFPLARCICCCGAWCESDGRNSVLWPDAVRVPAQNATSRIRREIAVLEGRCTPLPWTASRDEIFEFDSSGDWGTGGASIAICVTSPDRELKRTFEGLLCSQGYLPACDRGDAKLAAVVWDADPWGESLVNEMRAYHELHPQVAIIALMNFGHPQAAAEVMACGARKVVAKLSPAEELFAALSMVATEKHKRQEPQINADERR